MKKIIAIILCFLLCISTTVFSTVDTKNQSNAIEILTLLDIVEESELELMDLQSGMRRLDFVKYIGRILQISEFTEVYEHYYTDMEGHSTEGLVNELVKRNYLSVGDNRLFRPNDTITFEEALKVLVIMCGYEPVAQVNGGFPAGYLHTARKIDLISNNTQTTNITASDAFELILNTLKTPVYMVSSIKIEENGENTVSYTNSDENQTLLSQIYDVYFTEGFVEAAGGVSYSQNIPKDDEIIINSVRYSKGSAEIYLEDYFGKYAELYYKKLSDKSICEIVYLSDLSEEEVPKQTFEIEGRLVEDVTENGLLMYYKDDEAVKLSSVKLADNIVLIYNGKNIEYDLWDYFKDIEYGFVRLTDMDGDNIYDHGFIKSYQDFVIKFADENAGIIYDRLSTKSYDFGAYEFAKVYSYDYTELASGNLSSGMVLSVAEYEGEYLEAIVGNGSVKGVIQTVKDEGDKFIITVNDVSYETSSVCRTKFRNLLKAGRSGIFYLNKFDKVSFVELDDGVYEWGYLCNAVNASTFSEKVYFKVFGQDGEMKELECNDKIKIDGVQKEGYSDILSSIPSCSITVVEPQIIRYKLKDNKISELDTLSFNSNYEDKTDTLLESVQVSDYYNSEDQVCYTQGSGIKAFGMATMITDSTVVFAVPDSKYIKNGTADDEDFYIGDLNTFVADERYLISSYKTKQKAGFEDAVVYHDTEQLTSSSKENLILIEDIFLNATEDGNTVYCIKGMRNGNTVEYNVAEDYDFDGLTPKPDKGDVIEPRMNPKGEIGNIKIYYDYSKGGTPDTQGIGWMNPNLFNTTSTTSRRSAIQYHFVYPGYKDGSVVKCYYKNTADPDKDAPDEVYDMSKFNILVYDSGLKTNQVYRGSINDILDIDSVGSSCSKIVIKKAYSIVKDVIVYK